MMVVVIVLTIRPMHVFMLVLRGMVVRMRFVFGHNFGHWVRWSGILHGSAGLVMSVLEVLGFRARRGSGMSGTISEVGVIQAAGRRHVKAVVAHWSCAAPLHSRACRRVCLDHCVRRV